MLFNTAQYGIFFLVVFTVHWLLRPAWRRPFLLVASYYFYASAIPRYLPLILALTALNYGLGWWLGASAGRRRTWLLWLAVAGNLGSLAYFKYTELILSTIQPLLGHLPLLGPLFGDGLTLNIVLPLGISFFTFEFIHYAVEVYRGMPAMRQPVDFALFAAFFPTQIAGPIKRFPDFAKQLLHPRRLAEIDFDAGVGLILRGLLKKIVLADMLAPAVAHDFSHIGTLGPVTAWFAVFAFAAQIYGDFSGYTDIGRGCAILLGYSVPENFRAPYQSASPAEFWYRWHMSLSTWLRDYLYFPLGGSRVPPWRVYVNLMITMGLGGLWHGASWHFLAWGIYQGLLLCAHRLWERSVGQLPWYRRAVAHPVGSFLTRPATLVLVCVGWIFFRAESAGDAFRMLGALLNFSRPALDGWTLAPDSTPVVLMGLATLIVVGGWVWAVARAPLARAWPGWRARLGALQAPRRATLAVARLRASYALGLRPALYLGAVMVLVLWPPHIAQRFIYFQF
ncbi:MAG TPA: MBOAT family O-acyltransferase [Ktedonobacterales bacterium]